MLGCDGDVPMSSITWTITILSTSTGARGCAGWLPREPAAGEMYNLLPWRSSTPGAVRAVHPIICLLVVLRMPHLEGPV